MNLLIKKNFNWQLNHKIFKIFLNTYLIPEIQLYFISSLNVFQINKWDVYLKQHFNNYHLNVQNILTQGISNLKCKEYKDYYNIYIDYNQIIPGTSAKLYDICAIINSGTLEVPPYPIFENTFKTFSNIQWIKNLFEEFLIDLNSNLEGGI